MWDGGKTRHARDKLRCYPISRKLKRNAMADNDIETLMNARAALAKKRLTWAQTIASPGEIPEAAIRAIIEVQNAIDVIDSAIEELEEAHELEAEEEE
jgi:vacuolar-type H+-ATPase subunit C/Vma6